MLVEEKKTDEGIWVQKVIDYLKTLTPSGIELEIMTLTSYDFTEEAKDDPNFYVSVSIYDLSDSHLFY